MQPLTPFTRKRNFRRQRPRGPPVRALPEDFEAIGIEKEQPREGFYMIKKVDAANLLAGLDLGSAVAESDNLLEAARVATSVFDDLLADRIDLIPGTKGSGKTALYRIFVDFLPKLMLKNKKVVIAHGVQQRQDTVFLTHKKLFDQLSESDFVDFWCIYLMSLAYEQFIRADEFKTVLTNCSNEIAAFKDAYRKAGLPDFGSRKTLMEILAWVFSVLKRLKPRVAWTPADNVGQFELSLGDNVQNSQVGPKDADPRMPVYIDATASRLEQILIKTDLCLWLMVDRLDELFARRSETETRALRGLLQTLRLFRSDRIRVKVFLRDDILDQIIGDQGFTALTHVAARRSDILRWSEEQILTMIVRRIFANDAVRRRFNVDKQLLVSSIEYQRQQFYKVFANHVHRPPIKAIPYAGYITTPRTEEALLLRVT
jgi:hypothetical protein